MKAYLQSGLDALGNSTRMAIFQKLATDAMAVSELAGTMTVSRPAVSQHLKILKDAGLVSDTKSGTRRIYQLNPEGIALLRAHFEQVWESALGNFQTIAETPEPKPKGKHASSRTTRSRRT